MAPWRPPSFPCKSSFYSIKGVQPREVVLIGRKAKPIHLHLLEGNTNRLTKDEIEQRLKAENSYKQKGQGKATNVVRFNCQEKFRRIAGELLEDVITNIDVNALATYCDAYSDYVECTKIIREEGLLVEYTNKAETNKVPHPLLQRKSNCMNK